MSKGVHIDVNDTILMLCQAGVVAQHHQRPQRQPGQDKKQSHYHQHHYDFLLLPCNAVSTIHDLFVVAISLSGYTSSTPCGWKRGLKEGETNAGIHDHNKAERSKVDVGEQDGGVDFPHLLTGPILPAPVKGTGVAVGAKDNPNGLLFCYLKHDSRRAHDEHSQDPDDDNN